MDSDSRTNDKIPLPHSGERVPPRYKRAHDDAVKRHAIAGADRIAAFQSGSIHNKPFVRANNRQIGPQYRRYIARSSSPTSRAVLHDIHRTTSAKLKPRRIAPVNTARNPTCRLETPLHAVASVPAFISALAGE